ncbi:Crp/Fnr family transcriptional regulator [Paradesulfitobacterium aromaticivorans]
MEKSKCMLDLVIFSTLSPEEKRQVTQLAGKKTYQKGTVIFHEGDPADTIYIVKSGRIRLFKGSEGGKEITLDILEVDSIFGENSIFDEQFHSMTAQVLEPSFICTCTKADFEKMILQNPAAGLRLLKFLGKRLNNYTDQMADMAFHDVRNRLLKTLQRLASNYGKPVNEGLLLTIHLTHEDLASLVNASRVMITYTLNKLKEEGLISYTRDSLIIRIS